MDILLKTAYLLTQLRLLTLLSSLIARRRRRDGYQTKWRLPPQSVRGDRRLSTNVCNRAPRGPRCLIVHWLQTAIEPFALFYYSVFDYMCFTVMLHRWGRRRQCGPNIYMLLGAAAEVSREKNSKAPSIFPTDHLNAVPLLQFLFLCASVLHMWRLFSHHLFLISPSFGASGGGWLCFASVAFSDYLHLYFCVLSFIVCLLFHLVSLAGYVLWSWLLLTIFYIILRPGLFRSNLATFASSHLVTPHSQTYEPWRCLV